MGLRATVIRKYEVEYGNTSGFNYGAETLSNIISEFCEDYYCGDDGYGGLSTDTYWEINKEQFYDMAQELTEMPEDEFNELMKEVWFVGGFPDEEPYSKKYVLDIFMGWLDETPENSNYVRIGWL